MLSDRRGRPLGLRLTGGQRHDSPQARALVEPWTAAPLSCLIANRAYDVDALRAWLASRGIQAVIPARSRRLDPPVEPAAPQGRKCPRHRFHDHLLTSDHQLIIPALLILRLILSHALSIQRFPSAPRADIPRYRRNRMRQGRATA